MVYMTHISPVMGVTLEKQQQYQCTCDNVVYTLKVDGFLSIHYLEQEADDRILSGQHHVSGFRSLAGEREKKIAYKYTLGDEVG